MVVTHNLPSDRVLAFLASCASPWWFRFPRGQWQVLMPSAVHTFEVPVTPLGILGDVMVHVTVIFPDTEVGAARVDSCRSDRWISSSVFCGQVLTCGGTHSRFAACFAATALFAETSYFGI